MSQANRRPDIDGLRALAVTAVVGYHAFPHPVPRGSSGSAKGGTDDMNLTNIDGLRAVIISLFKSCLKRLKFHLKKRTLIWATINVAFRIKNHLKVKSGSPEREQEEPSLTLPKSQLCTAWQFTEPVFYSWCNSLHCYAELHRKKWEFAYILQGLAIHDLITPGKRGICFGCGQEPIPALLAQRGCDILATDLDFETAASQGWVDSKQHTTSINTLNKDRICPEGLFSERVSFRVVDMNDIPENLNGFDFLWSSCALEHLGSLAHGIHFIRNAMKCLKPGGLAIHTTEFTFSSDEDTLETPHLSIYRKRDMINLKSLLEAEGHYVEPFNWSPGHSKIDRQIDLPPYSLTACIRLRIHAFDCTSIGLIIHNKSDDMQFTRNGGN